MVKGKKGNGTMIKVQSQKQTKKSIVMMTKESLSIKLINENRFQQILNYFMTLSLYTFMFCRRGNGSLCPCHLYNNDKEQFISIAACFKQHSLLSL